MTILTGVARLASWNEIVGSVMAFSLKRNEVVKTSRLVVAVGTCPAQKTPKLVMNFGAILYSGDLMLQSPSSIVIFSAYHFPPSGLSPFAGIGKNLVAISPVISSSMLPPRFFGTLRRAIGLSPDNMAWDALAAALIAERFSGPLVIVISLAKHAQKISGCGRWSLTIEFYTIFILSLSAFYTAIISNSS